eukprot:264993_1
MFACDWSDEEEGIQVLNMLEWNNTDCQNEPLYVTTFTKDDGMYFNCPTAPRMCPYVKIKIYDLYNNSDDTDHNDHLCTIDTHNFEETSFITNWCMDLSGAFGEDYSYYIDCDASSVEFTSFSDDSCSQKDNSTEIVEGCDDPFSWNAYVQIAQCNDDGDFIDSNTLAPTSKPSDKSSDTSLIIIVVIVGIVVVVAALLIAAFIIRKKRMTAIGGINNESLHEAVSFDRLDENATDE